MEQNIEYPEVSRSESAKIESDEMYQSLEKSHENGKNMADIANVRVFEYGLDVVRNKSVIKGIKITSEYQDKKSDKII